MPATRVKVKHERLVRKRIHVALMAVFCCRWQCRKVRGRVGQDPLFGEEEENGKTGAVLDETVLLNCDNCLTDKAY